MADGFVKALEFKHRLRVCNAYPYSGSMDVFRSKDKLTDEPMNYKSCKDFQTPMKAGDKLEFKIGDASAGTFAVSDLPNLLNAQVAVIDTYKGTQRASPRIQDRADGTKNSRSEELRYSSIVAVNPGVYEVELDGEDGKVKAKHELVALNRESYIVLRTGVESKTGPAFPQELVVYPNSDPAALHSGASVKSVFFAVLAACFGI